MFVYTCVCSDFILILVMFCLSLLLSLTMLEQGHGSVGGVVALLEMAGVSVCYCCTLFFAPAQKDWCPVTENKIIFL